MKQLIVLIAAVAVSGCDTPRQQVTCTLNGEVSFHMEGKRVFSPYKGSPWSIDGIVYEQRPGELCIKSEVAK